VKRTTCRILPVLTIALVIATVSGVASAQDDSPFTTNYFTNNTTEGAPAGTLQLSNDGATVSTTFFGRGFSAQTLCANIYVFAADQQIAECCSCPVTPNGLVEENIKTDLLGNPLTRVTPNQGVIQIVAAVDTGVCDPTTIANLSRGLTAWTTHIGNEVGGAFPVSVTQNSPSTLSAAELNTLQLDCRFAILVGSGFGVCSCNAEAVN